ncbi:hypothetical protein QOZ80_9BG0695880 [Eleusine coracana subsp. coracana]|nr:hypothetical protein QOZ80_9BG0695880 [Eleusine coracana subsp. coracana]
MSGKEKKAADLEEKLQLLRSVTKSNAANETSILVDASKYIRELKDKVEAAGAAAAAESCRSSAASALPGTVSVSLVDLVDNISKSSSSSRRGGGFRINVSMERSRPGLLVSVLQVLEELGLDVLDADVSCADDTPFRLQALGGRSSSSVGRHHHHGHQQQQGRTTVDDEQVVRQAVLQAITKCMMGHNEGDDDDE